VRARLFSALAGLSLLTLLLFIFLESEGVAGPGALVFLIAVSLAAVLAWLIEIPARRATRFAQHLSRGELPDRLPETASGMTGDLFRALNRLAEAYRKGLEERGAEKTETEVLLREMGEGVLALDRVGRVSRVNAELQAIIGAQESLTGRAIDAVLRDPRLVRFLAPDHVPDAGHSGEFDVFGRIMLVAARRLPAGGVVAVFSDVTELRRLDRVRTEFVANASHELKTPLTAVVGFSEMLLDPDIPEADRRNFATRIAGHAERMTSIVDDLLTLARLEDPGYEIQRQRVVILPIAERILAGFSERAAAAGMETALTVEPADLELDADPEGLRQIIENLIDNAIRHAAAAVVTLRVAALPSGGISLEVEDDGRGIPAAHLERIFERFYRVDPSRSRATGGTGLGLAIVKHWSEQMGGRVTADSSLGEGTRIRVEFVAQ
jgi:two-component system phosphate regulon sensor histidine kinase PhoR